MIWPVLGMTLGIFWGIILSITFLVYGSIIIGNMIDLDEFPLKSQIAKLVGLAVAVPTIWWLVWVFSLYI